MSHEFTDGVMMQGEKAWHDLGQVVDGTLPAREAFTRANALFTVEKAPLIFRNPVTGVESASEHRCATYRTDTGDQLGTVSLGYEVIQNEELCKFAEMLRDDCEMETVVVLKGGAKIAFSAKILGTDAEVVKGDVIHRRLNGYLSHDGTTSFGGMFSNVPLSAATLAGACKMPTNKQAVQDLTHKLGVSQIDSTLRSLTLLDRPSTGGRGLQTYGRDSDGL